MAYNLGKLDRHAVKFLKGDGDLKDRSVQSRHLGIDLLIIPSGVVAASGVFDEIWIAGPATSGHVLTANPDGFGSWQAVASPEHIILRGFEIANNSGDADHDIDVQPGTLLLGSTLVNTTAVDIIQIDVAADWIDGSVYSFTGGIGFAYIYVNSSGVAKFEETAPAKADTDGNTAGNLIYHLEGATYWRCVGAVRVATDDTIDGFFQQGDIFIYDVPMSITTTKTASVWSSAIDLSTKMPAISKLGIFGIRVRGPSTNNRGLVFIRPNGSTWTTSWWAGAYAGTSANQSSSHQRECSTDGSQQIQYYTLSTTVSMEIGIEGFRINIR